MDPALSAILAELRDNQTRQAATIAELRDNQAQQAATIAQQAATIAELRDNQARQAATIAELRDNQAQQAATIAEQAATNAELREEFGQLITKCLNFFLGEQCRRALSQLRRYYGAVSFNALHDNHTASIFLRFRAAFEDIDDCHEMLVEMDRLAQYRNVVAHPVAWQANAYYREVGDSERLVGVLSAILGQNRAAEP